MNGKYIILLINYMNCIMIQQMTKNIGKNSNNQMSADQGNLGTLAINKNNEIAELRLGHKYQYNRDQLYELMLKVENDNRYKLLEPETCITIRQLRLNKHKHGKRGGTRKDRDTTTTTKMLEELIWQIWYKCILNQ